MNSKIFLNAYPISSGTRWVGELDLRSTVQYRYHSALNEDRFLESAEEAVEVGFIHANQLGLEARDIIVQVYASYDEYAQFDVFA